jgi:hypothetical protein
MRLGWQFGFMQFFRFVPAAVVVAGFLLAGLSDFVQLC